MNERYYVFKNGAKLGPFTLHGLLEEIEDGRADYEDLCLRLGSHTCEKLREVLDWEDADIAFPTEATAKPSPNHACEPTKDEDSPQAAGSTQDNLEVCTKQIDQEDLDDQQMDLLAEESRRATTPSPVVEELEESYDDQVYEGEQQALSRPPRDSTTILYSGRPSVLSYPNSLLFIAISLALGIYFRPQYDWALLAGLCCALLIFIQMQMRRTRHQYYITPKQIELIQGLILVNSREIPIDHIGAIHIRQHGMQGLVGLANIEFATTESPMPILVFHNVRAARRIKNLIRRLQDALEYDD